MIQQINIFNVADGYGLTVLRQGKEPINIERWPEDRLDLLNQLIEYAETLKSPSEKLAEKAFQIAEANATDDEILELDEIIPEWKDTEKLNKGQVRKKGGNIVRVGSDGKIKTIKAKADKKKSVKNWSSGVLYKMGELVKHPNGQVYKSKLAENVWSLDTFPSGWELVDGH